MIQEFLNLEFIKTIDDANFDKLKKASTEVVKKINKDKAKISACTLAALDPSIKADNTIILEVKETIIEHWSTFMANAQDLAVTFIRAVILEALEIVSKESSNACLIWLVGRNSIKYYNLGREKEILSKFLIGLGNKIESEVTENWSFSPSEEIELPDIPVAKINKTELEAGLKAAALHTPWGGENPAPQNQADQSWGTFFATRASNGISDVLNKTLKKQVNELRNSQSEFAKQISLFQMRAQLLWWKEAKYSLSMKKSYREINDGILSFVLANDYSLFVPIMYPRSIDFFLIEAYKTLSSEKDEKVKVIDLLKPIEENNTELKPLLSEFNGIENRLSLIDFIRGLVYGKFKAKQFSDFVGVPNSTPLSSSEFSLWLFHDLQSLKLSSNK